MTGPAAILTTGTRSVRIPRNRKITFRAMASDVTLELLDSGPGALPALKAAQQVFHDVEVACTRFNPASPLMQANRQPDSWHRVPGVCFEAIWEAYDAYLVTGGVFDPRVLTTLLALGYDGSLPFQSTDDWVPVAASEVPARRPDDWTPSFDRENSAIRLGSEPIDLGGIGKGLAVRWAADLLRGHATGCLVSAGGDCMIYGSGPTGGNWLVGVEDPHGGSEPKAVLAIRDLACATSSIRIRRWLAGGRQVHHLIDPASQAPGGCGLASVTVVGPDPARAEVWSKALFLAGAERIAETADRHSLAALWIAQDGSTWNSAAMEKQVSWRAAA
jgi:thiamine biosynthesis lipoprotein